MRVFIAFLIVAFSAATDWCAIHVAPGTSCAEQSQAYAAAMCAMQGIQHFLPMEHPVLHIQISNARDAYKTCEEQMRKSTVFHVPALVKSIPLLILTGIFLCVVCSQRRCRV